MEIRSDTLCSLSFVNKILAVSCYHAGRFGRSQRARAGASLVTDIIRWDYIGVGLMFSGLLYASLTLFGAPVGVLWVCSRAWWVASFCSS